MNEREWFACGLQGFEPEHRALSLRRDFFNHKAEDRGSSLTEEARGDTDRVGVADDR